MNRRQFTIFCCSFPLLNFEISKEEIFVENFTREVMRKCRQIHGKFIDLSVMEEDDGISAFISYKIPRLFEVGIVVDVISIDLITTVTHYKACVYPNMKERIYSRLNYLLRRDKND